MIERLFLSCSAADIQTRNAAGPAKKVVPKKTKVSPSATGIAVLNLRGSLAKYDNAFGTSLLDFVWSMEAAENDPNVAAVVILVDSGGGELAGSFEAAAAVAQAARTKPVTAVIEDIGASAAFLIASQSTRVFATNKLSLVGSIGVVMVAVDSSEAFNQMGLKTVRVRSGSMKGVGLPGTEITAPEIEYLTKIVQASADEFIQAVARGRKLSPQHVKQLASGELFHATTALQTGLIDAIRPLPEIIAELRAPILAMVADAQRYAVLIEARAEADTTPICGMRRLPQTSRMEAEEHTERAHPALYKAHTRFHAMPQWQRDELTALVSKGHRT